MFLARIVVGGAIMLASISPSHADTAPAHNDEACSRNSSRSIKIAGTDPDEQKCLLSAALTEAKRQAALGVEQNIVLQSTVRMQASDLAESKKRAADLEVWIKNWCGDKPGCFVPAERPTD